MPACHSCKRWYDADDDSDDGVCSMNCGYDMVMGRDQHGIDKDTYSSQTEADTSELKWRHHGTTEWNTN